MRYLRNDEVKRICTIRKFFQRVSRKGRTIAVSFNSKDLRKLGGHGIKWKEHSERCMRSKTLCTFQKLSAK